MADKTDILISYESFLKPASALDIYSRPKFDVFMDGTKLCDLDFERGRSSSLSLVPGKHFLWLSLLGCRSETVEIDVSNRQDVHLQVGFQSGFKKLHVIGPALSAVLVLAWFGLMFYLPQPIKDSAPPFISFIAMCVLPITLVLIMLIKKCLMPGGAYYLRVKSS